MFSFFLLVDVLRLPSLISIVLKGTMIIIFVYQVILEPQGVSLFNTEWFILIRSEVKSLYSLGIGGLWTGLPLIRTTLFLFWLWTVAGVVYRWLTVDKRFFPFFLCTIFYLAVMDTFTVYEGKAAIVRVFIYGLLFLAWFQLKRLKKRVYSVKVHPIGWFRFALAIVILASTVGWIAPKSNQSWPDPIYWISGHKKQDGLGRVGYGSNDDRLGGPFVQDERVAFTATVDQPYYWRGESRVLYTGKGWDKETIQVKKLQLDSPEEGKRSVSPVLFEEMETTINRAQVSLATAGPFYFFHTRTAARSRTESDL